MKILHVITSVNTAFGGPVEGLTQLAKVLVAAGHCVEVCSLDAPDAPWVQNCPLMVHPMGPSRGGYGYTSRFLPWLKKNVHNYDCVIVNGIWQYGSFGVHKALQNSTIPYFVFTHGMLDPWFKQAFPLKHIKKMSYWRLFEYYALRDARAVLFTCEEERQLARKSFQPYKCNEVVVTYGTAAPAGDPAIQINTFLEQYPALRSRRLLLFLSRIHVKKGCDLLLDAFADVADRDPTLHLVMAGPDQTGWQPKLQKQAERLGIASRITWTGMLSGDMKWGAFHAAEAFVLPSHQENFGIVVAEAMACGRPLLISNKINIWREIAEDGAGLVANDDLEGTTRILKEWLDMPETKKAGMRQNAKHCFTNRFEIHRAADSLLGALQEASKEPVLCVKHQREKWK